VSGGSVLVNLKGVLFKECLQMENEGMTGLARTLINAKVTRRRVLVVGAEFREEVLVVGILIAD
jgi:hypothetical protein